MESSGDPKLLLDIDASVADEHILVVDDIIDTGLSLEFLKRRFRTLGAASFRTCVLLDKPSRRTVDLQPDYVGFEIPDRFVVGYGIDYAEQFRELPYVGYVSSSEGNEK